MDSFPWRWFVPRVFDAALYLLVLVLVAGSIFFSALKVEVFGLIILIIGTYSEYRQSNYYSVSHIESSLISGEITHLPVHQIAKFRSKASRFNVVIIIVGSIMTGWGFFV